MKAYSEDLRERVIGQWQAGKSIEELIELFAERAGSIRRWIRRYQDSGQVGLKVRQSWKRPIGAAHDEQLRQQVERMPDATLSEQVKEWAKTQGVQVSVSSMWRALGSIGWSLKKRQWELVNATKQPVKPFVN